MFFSFKVLKNGRHLLVEHNMNERIMILGICLIKVCEVYARPLLSIEFLYQYHIGEPCGVLDFLNYSRIQKIVNFFLNYLLSFKGDFSLLLLY